MKQFLAVFTGSGESPSMKRWQSMDAPTQKARSQEGMEAWKNWGQQYQKAIVFAGGPLGKTKRVEETGIGDIRNQMAAYVIVSADSHAAAAEMFINHPHFHIFPGDSVEIMECLPVPG